MEQVKPLCGLNQFGLYNVMEDQMFLYYPCCFMVYLKTSGQDLASTVKYIEDHFCAGGCSYTGDHNADRCLPHYQGITGESRGILER